MSLSHFTLSFAMISKACDQTPKKEFLVPRWHSYLHVTSRWFSSARDAVRAIHSASALIHREHQQSWNWHSSLQSGKFHASFPILFLCLILLDLRAILKIGKSQWENDSDNRYFLLPFFLRICLFHKAPISPAERTAFIHLTKVYSMFYVFSKISKLLSKWNYLYSDRIDIFRILSL